MRWTIGRGLAVAFGSLVYACSLGAQDTSRVRGAERGILIDFQDMDVRLVITALAEAGGLNVSYGELPARRITLRMRQPVARENVLPLLRSIVRSNGLRLEEEAGLLRIDAGDATDRAPGDSSSRRPGEEPRLYVHRLRHAQAARLATTLQSIFGGGRGPAAGGVAPSRRGSLSQQLRDQRLPPTTPDSVPPVVRSPLYGGSLPAQLHGDIQIVPDEATNSLLVRAEPGDWEILRQAVDAMDLRPLQVMIEVLIAEVRQSREFELGVSVSGSRTGTGTKPSSESGELKSASATDFVLKLQRNGKIDLQVALAALATRGEVRILSRPILMAQNNQEAKILVGSQRPFVQVFRSLPTDNGVRDQIVQYRDVGTSLTITPTINPDDYVNLVVAQEVSTATSELQFGAPVISTREASTHLFIRDGQTAVLGGLLDRQEDRTRTGIPGLSSLPLIGRLFGTTRTSTITSELILFLTPHLVRTDEEMDDARERIEKERQLKPDTTASGSTQARAPVKP
ncbi:MAG: secretin N-terminal domain-containing protein [Gemmatimonadaceae bacterium]|nr:secretin N-terminal domain-containing protein [Gemmatimonadaceae bacterium]